MQMRLPTRLRPTRRRLALGSLALLSLGYSFATGGVPGVGAIFTADTENQNAMAAGGWIPAPSGLSAVVGGAANDERTLSWTSGASAASPSPNPVTGQTILAADGGSGSSASCGSYSTLASLAAGATTYSDGGAPAADWWCYQVRSDSGGAWTSSAAFTPVRLLVPVSVVMANTSGGLSGESEPGDTITITYNQDVSAKGTVAVHACKKQNIVTIGGGCNGTPSIGEITGLSVDTNNGYTGSSIDVSGPTVTITLSSAGGTSSVMGDGPFVASGNKVTAASDGTGVCGGSNCQPMSSGSF
jgi:hypothetical protein